MFTSISNDEANAPVSAADNAPTTPEPSNFPPSDKIFFTHAHILISLLHAKSSHTESSLPVPPALHQLINSEMQFLSSMPVSPSEEVGRIREVRKQDGDMDLHVRCTVTERKCGTLYWQLYESAMQSCPKKVAQKAAHEALWGSKQEGDKNHAKSEDLIKQMTVSPELRRGAKAQLDFIEALRKVGQGKSK
ncbi:MAG: hypothetical protein Q9221_007101 [Calogaya cf. arnoldii]